MSIPLVRYTFPVAAAEKYHLRCCIYLADHAKMGSERIWHEWAKGLRSNLIKEPNASHGAGNVSLGKPCSCRGLLISAQHFYTASWTCCTVSKLNIFLWGTNSIIKFLNAGHTICQLGITHCSAPCIFSPQHICEENQSPFFPLVSE